MSKKGPGLPYPSHTGNWHLLHEPENFSKIKMNRILDERIY